MEKKEEGKNAIFRFLTCYKCGKYIGYLKLENTIDNYNIQVFCEDCIKYNSKIFQL